MANRKEITLRTLAAELGLSPHTVSKALRGLPGMSERTRATVAAAAARLGYRTKEQERALRAERIPIYSAQPRRFAFVMPRRHFGNIHRQLLDGIQSRLGEFGHALETVMEPEPHEADSVADGKDWVERAGLPYHDGLFIPPLLEAASEARLLALRQPVILLNYPPPATFVDSVVWDVATAVHQSVRYLVERGHRRILYIGDITHHRGFRVRWHAFCEAMRDAGLEAQPEHHMTVSSHTGEAYVEALAAVLVREAPTALLVGIEHDLGAVYYACRSLGRTIPADYALIGLEHAPSRLLPGLTRPELLVRDSGARGVDRMLWRISNPSLPYEHIQIQGGFCDGDTVRTSHCPLDT
ncbi:LacI family DNA-binding transcriptional regulator [Paenibacillus sp. IB182496]|uniref:LacI family DNA-binding transcriptional regulator n=1 Tax=Paenibacillus sabuli TaxID=2772509 RepID=A0A927BUC7_9BACL|nr:LacI family DNA-binding transcriptional regulator [Paenibacillus sabuli]MBD2846986.1 LacI family DNA-binding transcriptional regulator [Paenibacillus sabuli]